MQDEKNQIMTTNVWLVQVRRFQHIIAVDTAGIADATLQDIVCVHRCTQFVFAASATYGSLVFIAK